MPRTEPADGIHPWVRHLLRPARGGAAGVVVVFAALSWLAAQAGFAGIWLGLILLSWFFKYAYILFDHVVRGVDEPPTLGIEMVNPVAEQRPLGQLLILLALGAIVYAAAQVSHALAVVLAILFLLIVPASVAVLGLEGNILKAVYPVALARMIAGLGVGYLAILGVVAGVSVLLALISRMQLGLLLTMAVALFAVLSIFSGLAGALYERRDELGLEAWHSPERTAEKERQAVLKDSHDLVTEAYGKVRVGAHTQAWTLLQQWLESRGRTPEDYRWLIECVTPWADSRYGNRLAQEYVDKLLTAQRLGEALDAVKLRLKVDPLFRPTSAAATLRLAQVAAQGGGASGAARTLVSDFGTRFVGDPLVKTAEALARHLGE